MLTVGGCSYNVVSSLNYTPPPSVQAAARPKIGMVTSIDQRKEAPNRLATIIGDYGMPVYSMDTAKPVKDEVGDAFTKGLKARGLLAEPSAPLRLVLTIRKFDADMIFGSTARIDMTVSVIDGSGRSVFEQTLVDSTSDFAMFKVGIYADIRDLQRMCQTVLDRTVDKVLDNPAFRAALGAHGV